MTFLRGYRIYEPINHLTPNPSIDTLIRELVEGTDFTAGTSDINWTETLLNSTKLQAGVREYRYVVPFDDENTAPSPYQVISVLNLVPPNITNALSVTSRQIKLFFNTIDGAVNYKAYFDTGNQLLPLSADYKIDKIISGLNPSQQYSIQVSSLNSSGDETSLSTAVQVTTLSSLLSPVLRADSPNYTRLDWFITDNNSNESVFRLFDKSNILLGEYTSFNVLEQSEQLLDMWTVFPNELYENIRVKSVRVNTFDGHNFDDESDFSNSVTIRIEDMPKPTLLLTQSNREYQLNWGWSYHNHNRLQRYELVEQNIGIVIDNLTNQFAEFNIPAQRKVYFVRVVDIDGRTVSSDTIQVNVYEDYILNPEGREDIYTNLVLNRPSVLNIYSDEFLILRQIDAFETNNMRLNASTNFVIFDTTPSNGALLNKIFVNNLNGWGVREGVFVDFKDNVFIRENTSTLFALIFNPTMVVTNSNRDSLDFRNMFSLLDKHDLMFREEYSVNMASIVNYNWVVIRNERENMQSGILISNNLRDAVFFRQGLNNTFSHWWVNVRQSSVNPINPVNIDNHDLIYNFVQRGIQLISNVNRVRILCVGDSITAGAPYHDPRYGSTIHMTDLITGRVKTKNDMTSQYPYWLQLRLGIDDYEVINEGTGRMQTAEVLFAMEDRMKLHAPQFVIVLIGTNDIFRWQDSPQLNNATQTAVNNIRQIVSIIQRYGAVPIIGTNLPRNSIVPPQAKDALRHLNNEIKKMGIDKSLDIIDWYDAFVVKERRIVNGEERLVENGVLRHDLSGDDTHPTPHGYRVMAERINLGIFNAFRAIFRVFREFKNNDVIWDSEEIKIQPNNHTIHYTLSLPKMRRLQKYNIQRFIKNTGNSWGVYVIEIEDEEGICKIWDDINKKWDLSIAGRLAPGDILPLRMNFSLPALGKHKEVILKINFMEFRR